jgi:predicted membrane-bound spermidine synthase
MTGAVSMGLEVLSSRCLSLIFGASLQAFAIVLMAFILGIGIGSAVIASPRRKDWPKEATTIALVLGAAAWIGVLVFKIEDILEAYRYVRSGLQSSASGYNFYLLAAGLFSIVVLGLPAAALGAVLPLWIRVVSETSDLLGDRVGRLLTWNTLGAVVGVLLTGFVLMPKVGLRGSFTVLALVLSGAALFVAWARHKRVAMALACTVSGLLLVVSLTGGQNWRLVLSSGVFRWRDTEVPTKSISEIRKDDEIVFYEDAADATVSVERDSRSPEHQLTLRVNGKVDASTHVDLSAQLLMAHLPLMVKPESEDVFVFGMGSGVTAGAVLGYPVKRLTVAENCEPVLRAAKFFDEWSNGVLTNDRTHICSEDARTVLKLSPQQFDVIIAEPSNPWTVGIGSVFSRDFYQIATNRLKPGGIMAQWFQLYEMNDGIVNLVIRTFASVFPVVEIWEADRGDIIMLGSDRPWKSDPEVYQRVFGMDVPRRQLASVGLTSPQMILARQFASQRTGFAIPGPGPIQTDEFPILEYQAPKAFYLARRARNLFQFDERTWQADLAPAEKNAALSALDDSSLKSIFGDFSSANPDLQTYVKLRYDGMLPADYEPIGGGQSLSCVFGHTDGHAMRPPSGAATNNIARQLFEAEIALAADPARQSQALEQIQKVLAATQPGDSRSAAWSAAYYASLATKASLRRGETQQARKILQRGLELDPDSELLQYLERVLERGGIIQLQPTTVAEAALR